MIDSRESEGIFQTVLVEVSVVDAHPPLVVVLFKNEDRIRQPLGVVNFLDEPSREQFGEFFFDGFSFLC